MARISVSAFLTCLLTTHSGIIIALTSTPVEEVEVSIVTTRVLPQRNGSKCSRTAALAILETSFNKQIRLNNTPDSNKTPQPSILLMN
jgi:hypothetical protein